MKADWLVYAVIGIGLLILFVCLVTIKPDKEGFQTNINAIDPALVTSHLRAYFLELDGAYAIDLSGNRKATEAVLKTNNFYTFPDIDAIKTHIYKNYIIGATRRNMFTGEIELISPDIAQDKVAQFYNDNYVGALEIALYGNMIADPKNPGQSKRSDTGIITRAANDSGNYLLKWQSEYGQKALAFNQLMRDLYSELAQITSANFIYDYENKEFIDTAGEKIITVPLGMVYSFIRNVEQLIDSTPNADNFMTYGNSLNIIKNGLSAFLYGGSNAQQRAQQQSRIGAAFSALRTLVNGNGDENSFINLYYRVKQNNLTAGQRTLMIQIEKDIDDLKYWMYPSYSRPSPVAATRLLDTSAFQTKIYYHGNPSFDTLAEVINSNKLCRKTYLQNEAALTKYVWIDFTTFKAYVRNDATTDFCLDPIDEYTESDGKTYKRILPVAQANSAICSVELTPEVLALFPFHARAFLKQYIFNRQRLYVEIWRGLRWHEDYREAYSLFMSSSSPMPDPAVTAKLGAIANIGGDLFYPSFGAFRQQGLDGGVVDRPYKTGLEYYKALQGKDLVVPPAPAQFDARKLVKLQHETYGINVGNRYFLDTLAQSFYELTDGSYAMTYIYDVFQIGKTVFDVRFDLRRHGDPKKLQDEIDAITKTYQELLKTNLDEASIDQARSDYLTKLQDLQEKQSENIGLPVRGAVARFFIEMPTPQRYEIKGVTFDRRAVTSFRSELNCGFEVASGAAPGTANYTPEVKFTKNRTATINCTDPTSLKRIMMDYEYAAVADLAPMFAQGKIPSNPWDLSGGLYVREVIGSQQLNEYQCAIRWKESIYDTTTNQELKGGIERMARISYAKNVDDWYANETVFDPSGFAWLPTASNSNKCQFDGEGYLGSYNGNNRLNITDSMTAAEKIKIAFTDLSNNGLKAQFSPCPRVNKYDRFSFNSYRYVNPDVDAIFGANRDRVTQHYLSQGATSGRAVAPAWSIPTFKESIKIDKRILADGILDDGGGFCPVRDCSDPTVLQQLMDSYNQDTKKPGVMLRIFKATTIGPNQCDVEAEIDYDQPKKYVPSRTQMDAPAPAPATKEKFQNPQSRGIQKKQLSLISSVDPESCKYSIAKVGDKAPYTIQNNTPNLAKPVDYGSYVYDITKAGDPGDYNGRPGFDSNFDAVEKTGKVAFEQIKEALRKYRIDTNTASAELSTLDIEGCPNIKCTDDAVIQKFLRSVGEYIPAGSYVSKILKAIALTDASGGTLNCEFTVTQEEYGYDQDNLAGPRLMNAPGTTRAYRAAIADPVEGSCSVEFKSFATVRPTMVPNWDDVKDVQDNVLFQKYAKFSEVMTNVENKYPKRFVSFTGKKARSVYRDTLGMGQLIERRALDISRVYVKYYPRDQKTNQVVTAGGTKEAVLTFNVAKDFSAKLLSQRVPTAAERTGGFRVGVPNESLLELITFNFDENNCKKTFDCADISKYFGLTFKEAKKDPRFNEFCEIRLTDDETLAVQDNYLRVAAYTESNCDVALNTVVPSTTITTIMAPIPSMSDPTLIGTKTTKGIIRSTFEQQFSALTANPRRILGRLLQAKVDVSGSAIIYMITMAEYDNMSPPNMTGYFDDGAVSRPAYLRCDFRRRFKDGTPFIQSMKLVTVNKTSGFYAINDPAPVPLEDPIKAMKRFKFLRFTPLGASNATSTIVQLSALQYFVGNKALTFSGGKVTATVPAGSAPLKADPTFLFSSDPALLDPQKAPVLELPLGSSIIMASQTFVQPEGISFMTGSTPAKSCTRWRIEGSLNGIMWKVLQDQSQPFGYLAYGFMRTPLVSFIGKAPVQLTQNPNRLQGLQELGITGTEYSILLDASRLVYESMSRSVMKDFKTTEPLAGRCFLTGIAGYVLLPGSNQILLKPLYDMIDGTYKTTKITMPNNTIVLTYSQKRFSDADAAPQLDTARSGITTAPSVLNAGGYLPYPKEPTKKQPIDTYPFGWGGFPSPIDQFVDRGAVKFEAASTGRPVPNLVNIDRYIISTPTGAIQKPYSGSTYSGLSREGAALICAGSPDCIGFFENEDGRSGVFYGMPTTDTRLVKVNDKKVQGTTALGQATILTYNHMYLKKGTLLFQQARLTRLSTRDPGSPIAQIGKVAFFKGESRIQLTLLDAIQTPSSSATADKLPSNLFDYGSTSRFWSGPRGASLTFRFPAPITADGLAVVTGPDNLVAADVTGWTLEVSLDGQTWETIQTKTYSPPTIRLKASPVFMFDKGKEDGQTNDFDIKTFDSCRQSCLDEPALNVMTDKLYKEQGGGLDNKNPITNPFNITRTGFNQSKSECILEFDRPTGTKGQVGFQFAPTYSSCDIMLSPDRIKINATPDLKGVQMNDLPANPREKYRYVRLRPVRLIGATTSIDFGKIILFDADGRALSVGPTEAIATVQSIPAAAAAATNPPLNVIDYNNRESSWKDSRLSTLLLTLDPAKVKYPLTAFTMIAGGAIAGSPAAWFLEASTDARFWKILHSTETHPAGALPRAPREQYLQYPFDKTTPPVRVADVLARKLDDFGQTCASPEIMDIVSDALASRANPILFDPVSFRYDKTTNKCEYAQKNGSLVSATFSTAFFRQSMPANQSRLLGVEVPSKLPLGGSAQAAPQLKGVANCDPKPACDDPGLLGRFQTEFQKKTGSNAPLSASSSALDPGLNECVFQLDNAYAGSLIANKQITSDKVGFQFKKQTSCKTPPDFLQVDTGLPASYTNASMRSPIVRGPFRFLRFRVTKIYDPSARTVSVGGFKFIRMVNGRPVDLPLPTGTVITNPTGSVRATSLTPQAITTTGWTDPSARPIVFQFTSPFTFDGYAWKASAGETTNGIVTGASITYRNDPVQWRLEGSTNGTFWTVIHEQRIDYAGPVAMTSPSGIVSPPCQLTRGSSAPFHGPFMIDNPARQYRVPAIPAFCVQPPPTTYSLVDSGLTCTSPSVWAAVKAAYNTTMAAPMSLQNPPAGSSATFKYFWNPTENSCSYSLLESRTIPTGYKLDTVTKYAKAIFPRLTSKPNPPAWPSTQKITLMRPASGAAPSPLPLTQMIF